VRATARNLAGWHEVSVRALGIEPRPIDGAWTTCKPSPFIYFDAIVLEPPADAEAAIALTARVVDCLAEVGPSGVCDPFGSLQLAEAGFQPGEPQVWWIRTVGGRSELRDRVAAAPELTIERVRHADGLREFEAVSVAGFGLLPVPPFSLHAPDVLDDPRMAVWLGRVDGRAVCAAMSFIDGGLVGVYGVATLPEARRRGYGEAITRRALGVASGLPSVLQPSLMGAGMYRRLGYRPFATFLTWFRKPRP
jgi:ribosomal protein S18 acetylase RimI-like enzyme